MWYCVLVLYSCRLSSALVSFFIAYIVSINVYFKNKRKNYPPVNGSCFILFNMLNRDLPLNISMNISNVDGCASSFLAGTLKVGSRQSNLEITHIILPGILLEIRKEEIL